MYRYNDLDLGKRLKSVHHQVYHVNIYYLQYGIALSHEFHSENICSILGPKADDLDGCLYL